MLEEKSLEVGLCCCECLKREMTEVLPTVVLGDDCHKIVGRRGLFDSKSIEYQGMQRDPQIPKRIATTQQPSKSITIVAGQSLKDKLEFQILQGAQKREFVFVSQSFSSPSIETKIGSLECAEIGRLDGSDPIEQAPEMALIDKRCFIWLDQCLLCYVAHLAQIKIRCDVVNITTLRMIYHTCQSWESVNCLHQHHLLIVPRLDDSLALHVIQEVAMIDFQLL